MDIQGYSLVAGRHGGNGTQFTAIDQASGAALDPPFHSALAVDIDAACAAAAAAAPILAYAEMSSVNPVVLFPAALATRAEALGAAFVGALPDDVRGSSRIIRDGATLWEKPFLSGESNMSHSIANLEAHHFKYAQFRRPGDVHVHFFGTATLSFAEGVTTKDGDLFEIEAKPFQLPLCNPLARAAAADAMVRAL